MKRKTHFFIVKRARIFLSIVTLIFETFILSKNKHYLPFNNAHKKSSQQCTIPSGIFSILENIFIVAAFHGLRIEICFDINCF